MTTSATTTPSTTHTATTTSTAAILCGYIVPPTMHLQALRHCLARINNPTKLLAHLATELSPTFYYRQHSDAQSFHLLPHAATDKLHTINMEYRTDGTFTIIADSVQEIERFLQLAASMLTLTVGLSVYAEYARTPQDGDGWTLAAITWRVTSWTEQYDLLQFADALSSTLNFSSSK